MSENWGGRLLAIIKRRGWSYRQAAEHLNISHSTIHPIINGKRKRPSRVIREGIERFEALDRPKTEKNPLARRLRVNFNDEGELFECVITRILGEDSIEAFGTGVGRTRELAYFSAVKDMKKGAQCVQLSV